MCFSDAAAALFSVLLTLPERAFEEILFSAICSALRFHTAKVIFGPHGRSRGVRFAPDIVAKVFFG
jgi:hypothetical protein